MLTGYFSRGSMRRASPKISRQYSAILACCFGLWERREKEGSKEAYSEKLDRKAYCVINYRKKQWPFWIRVYHSKSLVYYPALWESEYHTPAVFLNVPELGTQALWFNSKSKSRHLQVEFVHDFMWILEWNLFNQQRDLDCKGGL